MTLQRTSIQYNEVSYPYYYLCHYLPSAAGRDTLSHSLLKFKLGRQPDLSGWIDCALDTLSGILLPGATIVRALHHEETAARRDRPVSLDELGKALAAQYGCYYRPALLRKSRPTRPIKGFSTEQREAELRHLYSFEDPYGAQIGPALPGACSGSPSLTPLCYSPPSSTFSSCTPYSGVPAEPGVPGRVLIVDDILTTSTTIRAIIDAIRARCPEPVLSIFTLARAGYDPNANHSLPLKGQTYQLEQGMDWILAEPPGEGHPPSP